MIALLLLAISLQSVRPMPIAPGAEAWSRRFDAIIDVSPEHDGNCFAVYTGKELVVLDYDGRTLWKRDVARIRKWLTWGGQVAVSRQCDWAVFVGDPGYRYVWIFERDGAATPIAFRNETPVAAAIDPAGDRFAVGTGAERLYVYERNGVQAAMTRGISVFQSLAYSNGGDIITTRSYGAARFDRNGRLKWFEEGGFCATSFPESATWTLTKCTAPHGPQGGGVTARDERGRVLWDKALVDPAGLVSRDGSVSYIVGRRMTPQFMTNAYDEPLRLIVVGADGGVLADTQIDEERYLTAVVDDGSKAVLSHRERLHYYDKTGRLAGSEKTAYHAYYMNFRRNGGRILVTDERTLLMFHVK